VQRFRQIMGTSNDVILTNDDGTDGYLALSHSSLSLLQGLPHIHFVSIFFFHDAKVQKK
jgi:hypothetical protein